MTELQKKQLKEKILELIEERKTEIPRLQDLSKPVSPDVSLGRLTRQDAMQEQQLYKGQLERCKRRIAELQRCLGAVDNEFFGFCDECEEPIPFARLLLQPDATRCTRCAE